MSDSHTIVPTKSETKNKRRKRERQSSLTKPLPTKVDDVAIGTQETQDCSSVEQKMKKKKKRKGNHGGQVPDEVKEGEASRPMESESAINKQPDAKGFAFHFIGQEEEGQSNVTKRAKRKANSSDAGKGSTKAVLGQKEALDYLKSWHSDKESWSFKKKAQYWLLQNAYKKEMISKSDFKILLLYLESIKGNQRQLTINKAQQVLENYTEGPGSTQTPGSGDTSGFSKTAYKRAVEVLRVLS